MNKLCLIFVLFLIAFTSCDGRGRKHRTNAEILTESNLLKSFSEEVKYIPEHYTEIITDTILNNNFRIKIKYYSLNNDYVSSNNSSNEALVINHYKNFEAKIQVLNNNNIITENIINKHIFSKFENPEFWSKAIMQFIWVDYNASTKTSVNINTSFCLPETETCKDYAITINKFGTIQIKEINLILNTI
jgi:hypothetical protein